MEAEVVVWGDEEGFEQVALGQCVQLPRHVDLPPDVRNGATEPEEPDRDVGTH